VEAVLRGEALPADDVAVEPKEHVHG
jgi:hypothetical protein